MTACKKMMKEQSKEKALIDIISDIEDPIVELMLARSVLFEVIRYFSRKDEREYLPQKADHIENLLFVINNIFHNVNPELETAVNGLYEYIRAEKVAK